MCHEHFQQSDLAHIALSLYASVSVSTVHIYIAVWQMAECVVVHLSALNSADDDSNIGI